MEIFLLIIAGVLFILIWRMNKWWANADEERKLREERECAQASREGRGYQGKYVANYHNTQSSRYQTNQNKSSGYTQNARTNYQNNRQPSSIKSQIQTAINDGRRIRIEYVNNDGEISERMLSDLRYNNDFDGYQNDHIKAYCHLRYEERSFRIDRIQKIEVL